MAKNQDSREPSYTNSPPVTRRPVAVALKAAPEGVDAPARVVASGRGAWAEKILEIAFSQGIKVRQDADLAELLSKLDLDTPIPSEAIIAVAEILAKVYEANKGWAPDYEPEDQLAAPASSPSSPAPPSPLKGQP